MITADIQAFRQGMRQLAASACLITTGDYPDRAGLVATAVMSLSADPPQLVVAVNRTASAFNTILRNGSFVVNVLDSDDREVAERFGPQSGLAGDDRFPRHGWKEGQCLGPVLGSASAAFECKLAANITQSTHDLLIGTIVKVHVGNRKSPLLHHDGRWAQISPIEAVTA